MLVVMFSGCATKKVNREIKFTTAQEKMIDCYKLLKSFGESGKMSSNFCITIYEEEK